MSCVLFLFDMTEYRHAADSPYIQNTQKQKTNRNRKPAAICYNNKTKTNVTKPIHLWYNKHQHQHHGPLTTAISVLLPVGSESHDG